MTHAFHWTARRGFQDLGTLPGAEAFFSSATDITGRGRDRIISGVSERLRLGGGTDRRAVVFLDGDVLDLGTIGGEEGFAFAVNAQGDGAGESELPGAQDFQATLWTAEGDIINLAEGRAATFSIALDLNAFQTVVGEVDLPGLPGRGFVWRPGQGMQDLPPLPGDTSSSTRGVNDSDVLVGYSVLEPPFCCDFRFRAVVWVFDTPFDLNALVDLPDGWHLSRATAINNAGQIVGVGIFKGEEHGFRLTPKTRNVVRLRDLIDQVLR